MAERRCEMPVRRPFRMFGILHREARATGSTEGTVMAESHLLLYGKGEIDWLDRPVGQPRPQPGRHQPSCVEMHHAAVLREAPCSRTPPGLLPDTQALDAHVGVPGLAHVVD